MSSSHADGQKKFLLGEYLLYVGLRAVDEVPGL